MEISEEAYNNLKALAQQGIEAKEFIAKQNDLIATYKVYFELLSYAVIRFTGVFGLNNKDNTMIDEAFMQSGENRKDPTGMIMKSIQGLITDGMLSQSPGSLGRRKKAEMEQRFDFLKYLQPTTDFYLQQKQVAVVASDKFKQDMRAAVASGNFPKEVLTNIL